MKNLNTNNNVHYPRLVARSELSSKNNTDESKIASLKTAEKMFQMKTKYYNYNSDYGYLFDIITGLITDYRNVPNAIGEDDIYYSINVSRETLETYAFGEYKNVRADFWRAFTRVVNKPKTLLMHTAEGDYIGLPINIVAKLQDGTILKPNFENLNNATQMIKSATLQFFKPMFRTIVDNSGNWIPLPRNLQAKIVNLYNEHKELFNYKPNSNYKTYEEENITPEQLRLYFLYVSDHNNGIGETMKINAIPFWLSVHPRNIKKIADGHYCMQDWYKAKFEFDALAKLHSELATRGEIEGINFTTCKAWYEKTTKTYEMIISRDKPLKLAPPFKSDFGEGYRPVEADEATPQGLENDTTEDYIELNPNDDGDYWEWCKSNGLIYGL